jgi:DNA-binding GntR family transcriptional regulator
MEQIMVERNEFRAVQVAAPLRQSVVGKVRDAILTGHYLRGARLPEKELCDLTGVSRTLIREALRQLEAERLVEVVPNRGPFVVEIPVEQAAGIYLVREQLEGLAAELFAAKATAEQRKQLELAFSKLRKAIISRKSLEVLRGKDAFYQAILEGAGNAALNAAVTVVMGQVRLLQASWQRDPGRDSTLVLELGALVSALVAGNVAKSRALSDAHVKNAAKVALSRLANSAQKTPKILAAE